MTDLPQGWREVALGEVSDVLNGDRGKNYPSKKFRTASGVPFVNAGHLEGTSIAMSEMDFISEEHFALLGAGKFTVGDILFCIRGSLGKLALNKSIQSGAIASSLVIVRPRDKVTSAFLHHFLSSPQTSSQIKQYDNGTAQPNLAAANFKKFIAPLPPLAEQEHIVEILEEQFSRLDSALASVKAVREKAKAFRRSLLHAAFNGELTGGTDGWREVALKDAAEVVMGQSPPSSAYNEVGAGKPFFQGKAEFGDKHPTVKKWTTEGSKHSIAGDILMSVRAPVGPTNIANVDCVIGRGLAAIRAGSLTNQTYLLWVLRSIETDIAARGVGTTFASISGGELRSTRLPLPPLAEQERIVEILEEQFSKLDKALEVANQLEARIASERRSLLHAAFTGELTSQWRKTHV